MTKKNVTPEDTSKGDVKKVIEIDKFIQPKENSAEKDLEIDEDPYRGLVIGPRITVGIFTF